MDVSDTLDPNTDRVTGADFIAGPREFRVVRAFTIPREERRDGDTQKYPLFIFLDGMHDRPWRPPVTVRRFIAAGWGNASAAYPGRLIRLYRDGKVRYGKEEKGGVRIAAMSAIDPSAYGRLISVGRGAPVKFAIELMEDPAPTQFIAAINAAPDLDTLRGIYTEAQSVGTLNHPDVAAAMETKKKELGA